jgi:hypothetical protein
MALMPALTVCLSWQRGVLVSRKNTSPITGSAVVEVVTTILTLALCTRTLEIDGATSAALALVAGEIGCALFLAIYLARNRAIRDL